MVKWIDVLRRLLALYNVHTQAELGMAMAMPIDAGIEESIQDKGMSWKILEKAVREKHVDWNWLMTGSGVGPKYRSDDEDGEQDQKQEEPAATKKSSRLSVPSLDTRELERVLLENDASAVTDQLDEEIAQMEREDNEKEAGKDRDKQG